MTTDGPTPEGPWNPGVESSLSRELLSDATILRSENVFTDLRQALELQSVTGLALDELVVFRPERLALHEILVRLTANFEVPDPEEATIPSLGINFRNMVQAVLARGIEPSRSALVQAYDDMRLAISQAVSEELADCDPVTTHTSRRGWLWGRKQDQRPRQAPAGDPGWHRDEALLQDWTLRAAAEQNELRASALRALIKVASAILGKHGRISHRSGILGTLATNLACNDHGARLIGGLINPWIDRCAEEEGFRSLPRQDRPVLMICKGASASGKSTMRPLQRLLATGLAVDWRDFALISPDIWRRILLDFESLGSRYKYAGMLTGHEVEIIDRKLTKYLRQKGERGLLSHLLIDRFSFDTFALDSDENRYLVSHFAGLVSYSFMITPPQATVERAWQRGLEVGRYKAVDDLLAHNIDAFRGMQNILFGRALIPSDSLHYEFLDNNVPRGKAPLTAAFGWGGEMNILDVVGMIDICRNTKINVAASGPDQIYPGGVAMAPESNIEFLASCIRRFPKLNLAERNTGRIYARFAAGVLQWVDRAVLEESLVDAETRAALTCAAPHLLSLQTSQATKPEILAKRHYPTLGRWGQPSL